MKRGEYKVIIEADFSMTKAQLYEKLKHWIEHHAHTSSSFGFTFVELKHLGINDD